MTKTITKKRTGYTKQISPQSAIKEMKLLRIKLAQLERNLIVEDKSWINISGEVSITPDISRGKIIYLNIFHHCWCVGSLWWEEYPNFRVNSKHYKIEWVGDSLRVLWDGKGR